LCGARIAGANLRGAILDNTNLEGADLSNATLAGAWLHGTNFKNALLAGIKLGEYPSLLLKDRVYSCCYSRDGRLLAVAAGNNVEIYEASSRRLLQTLASPSRVTSVHFSPDGTRLASGGHDNTVKLWSVVSGELERTLAGHKNYVNSVHFSPDGMRLASGSKDKTVKLWSVGSGELERTLVGHEHGVTSVQFSPDERHLASGSHDNTVKLWSVGNGTLERTLAGHTSLVESVHFSPDGTRLASGSLDKTVKLWSVSSGTLERTLAGHMGAVTSAHFSPDGARLALGGWDKTVKLWSVGSGTLERTLVGHMSAVTSLHFSPDGTRLASGSEDKTVKLWSVDGGQLERALTGHTSFVESVHFSPDGTRVASGSLSKKTVELWSADSGELERTFAGHKSYVNSVHFSPDGTRVASGSGDNTVKLWSVSSGELERTLAGHTEYVESVHFSPDGTRVASGSGDKTVKLWSVGSGTLERTLAGHTEYVESVHFSPDGTRLASGSFDRTVKLWSASSGESERTLAGHEHGVSSVQFSPDGTRVASGSFDKTVKLWLVESGELERTLAGHMGGVISLHFSPDGQSLVSAGRDHTLRVWDRLESKWGTEFSQLTTLSSNANSISIKQHGDEVLLVSGHDDGSVRCWKLIQRDNKPYLQLEWSTSQNALLSQDTDLEGARGLTLDNADLLKQRGAISEPLSPELEATTIENQCSFELASEESDEYKEVLRCYEFNPVPGHKIAAIEIINNPIFTQKFEITKQQLQAREGNPVFKPNWADVAEDPMPQAWRKRCYEFFKEFTAPFKDTKYPDVDIALLWHGTTQTAFNSIQNTGFVNLATTDDNFFGDGIYGTIDAEYANRVYAVEPAARRSDQPVLLVNSVACFATYPQIESPWAKKEAWQTKSFYKKYDTRFVWVSPRDPANKNEVNYDPSLPWTLPTYSEIVCSESACIPRYRVELKLIVLASVTPKAMGFAYEVGEKCLNEQQPLIAFYYLSHAKKAGDQRAEERIKELTQKGAVYAQYKNVFK